MNEKSIREKKIKECLQGLENIHQVIESTKLDNEKWREEAAKSFERQLSALRLWQSESRLLKNYQIAFISFAGVLAGGVLGVIIKYS